MTNALLRCEVTFAMRCNAGCVRATCVAVDIEKLYETPFGFHRSVAEKSDWKEKWKLRKSRKNENLLFAWNLHIFARKNEFVFAFDSDVSTQHSLCFRVMY